MARKADWSLIDAQIKARDSQDRQGRFSSSVPRTGMPSNYQQRRASGQRSNPSIVGLGAPIREVTSARATYSYPDAASISSRPSPTERTYLTPTRNAATAAPVHDPYSRAPSLMSNTGMRAKTRGTSSNDLQLQRKTNYSSMSPYRAADASMFNSNVTPKAKRVEDKKPRSRMSPDQNVFW